MAAQMASIWTPTQPPRNLQPAPSNFSKRSKTCTLHPSYSSHTSHSSNQPPSTPGKALEERLNRDYGPGNPYYQDFCTLIKQGLQEGWVASGELDGPKYRRGRIRLPLAENLYMSLTAVYFDSQEVYAGQYHKHPYGE